MVQTEIHTQLDAQTRLSSPEGQGAPQSAKSPLVYAGVLAAAYLLRKQLFHPGTLLAAGSAYAVWRKKGGKLSASPLHGLVKEQATFTINKPADQLYEMWHDIEQSPKWMESIRSVKQTGAKSSHWVMDLPGGRTLEWDAEWTAEEPGKRLAWHTVGETPVPSAGQISFEPAVSGRGTVVRVDQESLIPGGKLAAALGGLFARTPGGLVKENLRHFKQLNEAGEIPTTKGQPHGRRGAATSIPQALEGDREQQPTVPQTGAIAHKEVA